MLHIAFRAIADYMDQNTRKHAELKLQVRVTDTVLERSVNGRDYLVVPAVAVVEKVLNGEFLSAAQIAASVTFWNGRAVVIDHPDNWESAANVSNFLSSEIGTIRNAEFQDAKLVVEMWIDLQLADQIPLGKEVVQAFRENRILEVSTGYWSYAEHRPGNHNGDEYEYVQYGLVPDHLAILPDQIGACSVADGCGAPRRNQEDSMPEDCECTEQEEVSDVPEVTLNDNQVASLAERILRALNIGRREQEKQENAMSEQIERLLATNAGFSREELEALPESTLEKMGALVANEAEEEETPQAAPAPAPVVDNDRLTAIEAQLGSIVEALGARSQDEVAQVTNRLVASGRYTAEELQGHDLRTLKLLSRGVDVDYGVIPAGLRRGADEEVIAMPSINGAGGKK